MSEFKFSCPACGQHLSCSRDYAGVPITCPTCQKQFAVPAPGPPPIPSRPPIVPQRPPPPATLSRTAPQRAGSRTSGLAVASLICSCVGLFIGYFGTIPGIVCGVKANAQIKREPGLGGKGLATAGLLTGIIVSLLWVPLTYILVVATISGFRAVSRVKEVQRAAQELANDTATDLTPDGSGWTPELEGVSIPDTPVSGRVQGLSFTPRAVELDQEFGDLEFQYDNFQTAAPHKEELITVTLRFDQTTPANYAGRTFIVRSNDTVSIQPPGNWGARKPTIRMVWIEPGQKPNDTLSVPYKHALRLEFGELKNGKLPGKIYLCVLDRKKSFLRGKFLANVKGNAVAGQGGSRSSFFVHPGDEPPADTTPDAAGWTFNLQNAVSPDSPATGRVHGVTFRTEQAMFQGPQLHLRQGAGVFPLREFQVLLWDAMPDPTVLSGRTIEVGGEDPPNSRPQVTMEWMEPGGQLPVTASGFGYVMRLEFGQVAGGKLPGKIYLCLLDREKSFVRGKFVVNLQQFPSMPAQPRRFPPRFNQPSFHPAPPGGR